MFNPNNSLLLTVPQLVARFGITAARVRAWIAEGELVPVRRVGPGSRALMQFAQGQVAALVYARCRVCGEEFKRAKSTQVFCSRHCRQRAWRLDKGMKPQARPRARKP